MHSKEIGLTLIFALVGAGVIIWAWIYGFPLLSARTSGNNECDQAALLFGSHAWEAGITVSTDAIKKNPNRGELYYYRGQCYQWTHNYGKAEADYSKAIELLPAFANAYMYRGWMRNSLGKLDEAILDLRKAVELAPQSAYGHGLLAWQYGSKLVNPEVAIKARSEDWLEKERQEYRIIRELRPEPSGFDAQRAPLDWADEFERHHKSSSI